MQPTLRAALWMIGAILAFTSMAVSGRAAALDLDTFEIMLYRSCVGLIIVLIVGKSFGTLGQIRLAHMGLHSLRNLAHFSGQNLWFYAITVIPLAQVFALEFTTPIWVILLSPLILREKITPIGAISAIIGFVGILIVACNTAVGNRNRVCRPDCAFLPNNSPLNRARDNCDANGFRALADYRSGGNHTLQRTD